MTAKVIPLFEKNEFGFSHIRCAECHSTQFVAEVESESTTRVRICRLHCAKCTNWIELLGDECR